MKLRLRHLWKRARTVAAAAHGSAGVEGKLVLLGVIGAVTFLALVLTLFTVQRSLGHAKHELADEALPSAALIAELESSIKAAFRRQAQISTTQTLQQLDPLTDRRGVEVPLRKAGREIVLLMRSFKHIDPESLPKALRLPRHIEEFLAADEALLESVEARHGLEEVFDQEMREIDGDLRALVQSSQAVSGILRLERVLLLRRLAGSLRRGGPDRRLVDAMVFGDLRTALTESTELADAVQGFGMLAARIGSATSSDKLASMAANELPQNVAKIDKLLAALSTRTANRPEVTERLLRVRELFAGVVPHVLDGDSGTSLVSLRRRIVAEQIEAARIRARALEAANDLASVTAALQRQVAVISDRAVKSASLASTSAWIFSIAVSLLGLFGCVIAVRRIREGIDEMEALNAGLESTVADRTRSLQRVLDSMTEGLATVSLDGTLRSERSSAFSRFFGDAGSRPIWQVLFPDSPRAQESFAAGFQQLAEDVLPFELAAEQLPRQVQRAGRTLQIELRAVQKAERLDGILLVARDVTEELAAQRAERQAREEQRLMGLLLRDPRGFRRAVDEVERLFAACAAATDAASLRRALHTLKGNCAVLGFASLSEHAHALEDRHDADGQLPQGALPRLQQAFRAGVQRIHDLVEGPAAPDDRDSLAGLLQPLAAEARRLAAQLGKLVEVSVEADDLRVQPDRMAPLAASLIHAVRNALDHGVELPQARLAAGKPETARLSLRARTDPAGRLLVSISDDGRGVDVDAVRARAAALGLPCSTRAEILDALFADGLSTSAKVTELSGRGVGASAIRAACRELGGEATVASDAGRGTELRCVLPGAVVQPSALGASHAA